MKHPNPNSDLEEGPTFLKKTENEIDKNAKLIWDYMLMKHELKPADAVFGLGSNDVKVATRATELFLLGYGKYLIFAGESGAKYGKNSHFKKPEAEVFADVALSLGVEKEKIIIENRSSNTGENITFVRALLKERNILVESLLLVQKPYMERRTYATFKNFWPEVDCQVTSPQISFDDYKRFKPIIEGAESFVDVMVGDLQRIKEYPAKGFQIPQEIPSEVWQAYEKLISLGFTRRLIKV